MNSRDLTPNQPFTSTYSVDVMNDPAFSGYSVAQRERYIDSSPRVMGTIVILSGAKSWTYEGFIRTICCEMNLSKSWEAVLSEDNYVSRAINI